MCTCAYRVIPNVVLYYFWHLRSAQSSHLYCRKAELFDTRRRILNAHCQLGFLFCCLSRFSIHFSLSLSLAHSHSYSHSVFVYARFSSRSHRALQLRWLKFQCLPVVCIVYGYTHKIKSNVINVIKSLEVIKYKISVKKYSKRRKEADEPYKTNTFKHKYNLMPFKI